MIVDRPATRIDLHMHTTCSDGRFEPQEVLRRCASGGLDVVAITDHDLVCPIRPGVHELDGRQLRVVAAAEMSGVHEGKEYHLLCYFPGEVPDGFHWFCEAQCRSRAERYRAALLAIDLPGLNEPDALALDGERALTRHHIARQLVALGHARNVGDAFARYLSAASKNVPRIAADFSTIIRLARAHGALTSWAHPSVADVDRHLDTFAKAGLQGIEGLRPTINARQRNRFRRMARRYGLFLTGGSDWHGWKEADLGLFYLQARELGDFVEALEAA